MKLKSFRHSIYRRFSIVVLALFGFSSHALAQTPGKPLALPVKYDEDRFYIQPITGDGGVTLNFFTDTGGGLFIFADAAERLKLPLLKGETKDAPTMTTLPKFKVNASIPAPTGKGTRIFVAPVAQRNWMSADWSGMLGQQWFAGRIWTFDYPKRQLLLRADGDSPKQKQTHRVALGFQTDSKGVHKTDFPRIQVVVDGDTIDLLFDTGATTSLTDTALTALNDKRAAIRATSFITTSIFEKWRKAHPQWKVVENAEKGSGQAMIEVPSVSVAGYAVGPVWFTRRPDKNFHEYMSQWMDKRVEGALGGNALRSFRITVDYPHAVAVFER